MEEKVRKFHDYCIWFQKHLCDKVQELEPNKKFVVDSWEKAPQEKLSGYGHSCVLENAEVLEKGGINFSFVSGKNLPKTASASRPKLAKNTFQALGTSIVFHPRNPYCPTSHCNIRLFIIEQKDDEPIWWFGGGFDLTPFYPFKEDVILWHQRAKQVCDQFGSDVYPKFKKWCDDYFYIKFRNQQRGVGGLFFDDLNEWGFEKCLDFVQQVAQVFCDTYIQILQKRHKTAFGEREREFQLIHRGRYAEFNLVLDRGTLFGLQSGGRTKSILMSMPPSVKWIYDYVPPNDSPEEKLYNYYLKPQDWLA